MEKNILYQISQFIVGKRNLFFFVFILMSVFSMWSMSLTVVQDDIIGYLNEETATRKGLAVMDEEFITYATSTVMINNVDYATALNLSDEIKEINYIKSISFDDTEDFFKDSAAKFSITFEGDNFDDRCFIAMDKIYQLIDGYDTAVESTVGASEAESLAEEMAVITVIVVSLILVVMLFTLQAYAEIPVLLMTFGMAALLNLGSNFIFDEISFVSNSISVVLQLALGIDYAIILCHRFSEEREHYEAEDAVTHALSKAIIEISSSSVTTICGLIAMSFMDFGLGADMSRVLIKAILCSLFSVFTLMPGLLVVFSDKIDKTKHRNFIPSVKKIGVFALKVRYITIPIFIIITVVACNLSLQTEYTFSPSTVRAYNLSEEQIQADRITEKFGSDNVLALIVPSGDYEKEKKMIEEIETLDHVDKVMGLSNTEAIDGHILTELITAREFSELMDLDYEMADLVCKTYALSNEDYAMLINQSAEQKLHLIDVILFVDELLEKGYVTLDDDIQEELSEQGKVLRDAKNQLESDSFSRILIFLDAAEESVEAYTALDEIEVVAYKYFDEMYKAGNVTSNYDLSSAFVRDNMIVSVLSALFVMIVLLCAFGSVAVPIMLILVIQSAIFINFAFPYLQATGVFFVGYLVVSSIQMGANVDYAIVITSRFLEIRKKIDDKEAIVQALDESFTTVLTSGTILGCAGIILQNVTTDGTICILGECIGRGTFISMFLVIFILPAILYSGAKLIDKTMFRKEKENEKEKVEGKECQEIF